VVKKWVCALSPARADWPMRVVLWGEGRAIGCRFGCMYGKKCGVLRIASFVLYFYFVLRKSSRSHVGEIRVTNTSKKRQVYRVGVTNRPSPDSTRIALSHKHTL